jgi:peptidyl-prolyl cis-trans isomerase SurA
MGRAGLSALVLLTALSVAPVRAQDTTLILAPPVRGRDTTLRLAMPGAFAQDTAFVLLDRIAAVVGISVIPASRVEEELNVYRQQGGEIPEDSAGLRQIRREILQQLVDQELLVQAALRDTTVRVNEQEVQQEVERAIRQVRSQFGSELEFAQQLQIAGFSSTEEYRRWFSEQTRRDMLRRQYLQMLRERGELVPLAPTEEELREFYELSKPQQPQRPATVSFRQIVVRSEGDSAAVAAARSLADSLVGLLRAGADFGQLARQYSSDPGSQDQGGELGWVRRGRLVPEFDRVAFRIKPGEISDPVRSVFGYHIIQVERRQPSEVMVRHILLVPEMTDADRARARETAQEVLEALQRGADFDSLADLYHDTFGQEQSLIEDFPEAELPAEYREQLEGADTGDAVGPIVLDRGDQRPKFAVVLIDERRSEGTFSFEDLRDQLRTRLSEQAAMERLIRSLRDATYIDIRM